MPKALVVAMGLGLGTMALVSLSNPINVHADNGTIQIISQKNNVFSYSHGFRGTKASEGGANHPVTGIKDSSGNYVFCIEWTKDAPGYTTDPRTKEVVPTGNEEVRKIDETYRDESAVQWLINNYYSGNRYRSLGKGNEGDYWLYQVVIHWIADPKADQTSDGAYGVHDAMKNMRDEGHGDIADKIQQLHDEAMKHNNDSSIDIMKDNHMMSFNPDKLEINKDDLKGDHYEKEFTFNDRLMKNVSVEPEGQPNGVSLESANGSVDFHNVQDNAKIRVKIPYKINADKDEYNFKIKAKGIWTSQAHVAAIYQGNPNKQKVEKQIVIEHDVDTEAPLDMPVTVKPAKGSVRFKKQGSGNNFGDILKDTEFTLTGGNVKQVKKTDSNGYIEFDNLPLGQDYKLDETGQPNPYYANSKNASDGYYHTTITNFNGDNPVQNWNLNDVNDDKRRTSFVFDKKNVNGQGLSGAQFVIVRSDQGSPKMSIDEAKKNALRQVDDGSGKSELVEGHGDQQPFIATSDSNGKVNFDRVLLPNDHNVHSYYAVEVKAPQGYTLSQDSLKLQGSYRSPDTVTGELKDSTMPLPATGSEKLLVVTVAGVVLAVIAGGVVYFNRKKTN